MTQTAKRSSQKNTLYPLFQSKFDHFLNKKASNTAKKAPAVAIHRGNFCPKKITGKELDSETGLYYYGARYLDPKTGRWLNGDPAVGEYIPSPGQESSKLSGMGGVYNTVNLHAYHYAFNNPVRYIDPNGREGDESKTVSEQLNYLMEYVANTENMTLQEKADAARNLRIDIRSGLYDLDGLITGKDGNEQFMNETLRDFLNTSDTGEPYSLSDMLQTNGWRERPAREAQEHQQFRHPEYANRKFTNNDGREAIFTTTDGINWKPATNIRDKGTYNYARNTGQWTAGSDHGKWDMNPYFRQFGITPSYRSLFSYNYSRSDYNSNGRANGTGHYGP